jgi:hypothetical protein
MPDFDLDLRYGLEREGAFRAVLEADTVEVKSDRQAVQTGNLFLEYARIAGSDPSLVEPSGLHASSADVWAYEWAPGCWLVVPTAMLRAVVAAEGHRHVWGGDGGRARGVLVSLTRLIAAIRSEVSHGTS